jgi:hypothetical protein
VYTHTLSCIRFNIRIKTSIFCTWTFDKCITSKWFLAQESGNASRDTLMQDQMSFYFFWLLSVKKTMTNMNPLLLVVICGKLDKYQTRPTLGKKPQYVRDLFQYRHVSQLYQYTSTSQEQKKYFIKYAVQCQHIDYIEYRLRQTLYLKEGGLSIRERNVLVYYAYRYQDKHSIALLQEYMNKDVHLIKQYVFKSYKEMGICKSGNLEEIAKLDSSDISGYHLAASGNLEAVKRFINIETCSNNILEAQKAAELYGHVDIVSYLHSNVDFELVDAYSFFACMRNNANRFQVMNILDKCKMWTLNGMLWGSCRAGNLKAVMNILTRRSTRLMQVQSWRHS